MGPLTAADRHRAAVLSQLAQPVTQAEICSATGLDRAAVSRALSALSEEGLARPVGRRATPGRRGTIPALWGRW